MKPAFTLSEHWFVLMSHALLKPRDAQWQALHAESIASLVAERAALRALLLEAREALCMVGSSCESVRSDIAAAEQLQARIDQALTPAPKETTDGGNVRMSDLRAEVEALRVALAAQPEALTGAAEWQMVPVEPTPEMMKVYQQAFISEDRFDGGVVFSAMVKAAPRPPAQPEPPKSVVRRLATQMGWTPPGVPAPSAEPVAIDDGLLWSWLRSVMSQGADIWHDAKPKGHEAYSARLDAAASERTDEFLAKFAATTVAAPAAGEPWASNPDGIVPGQERGPRQNPHTGEWEGVPEDEPSDGELLLAHVRQLLDDAEWQDKVICAYRPEDDHQNWLVNLYLHVPMSANDKSPEASLRYLLERLRGNLPATPTQEPAGQVSDEPLPIDLCVELREALGLFAGAMSCSPKQAWNEAIARAKSLVSASPPAEAGVMEAFNRAINFAIGQGSEAATFLSAWREGATDEWPEFDARATRGADKGEPT